MSRLRLWSRSKAMSQIEVPPESPPSGGENAKGVTLTEYVAEAAEAERRKRSGVASMKLEIEKIDDIYDAKKDERVFAPYDSKRGSENANKELPPQEITATPFVLRRVFNYENKTVRKTMLDIKSYLVLDIIKEVVKEERAGLEGKSSILWPSANIFRYREKIREAAAIKDELTMQHVNVLLELIEQEYASQIRDIKDLFPKGTSTFNILREAFWPGDIIVDSESCSPRSYRVTDARQGPCHLYIDAVYMDCDGRSLGTVEKTFVIDRFEGIRYINSLVVFPLKYHPQQTTAIQNMINRGQKFAKLLGQHHKVFKGVAMAYDRCKCTTVDSRIMIDTYTFNRLHPGRAISVSVSKNYLNGVVVDEDFMLMTNTVPIFSLSHKEFFRASIDDIEDIHYDENSFGQLVLNHDTKRLIRVLVDAHSKSSGFDDFVEGKGKGLVLLLHGPPGVGKTMTAETVSEHTRRPLYIITSGELGTSVEYLEKRLAEALDLANTFRAVLLIDEADVFLEKRTPHDVGRNALVSVFLRLLEYYQGILFLTTNRMAQFDEAFHSRIHITLRFSDLTPERRRKVWQNFSMRVIENLSLAEEDFDELAQYELNGRQIKNILNCSHVLSAAEGESTRLHHIKQVLDVVTDFSEAKEV